jgi:hypothetical protein
MDRTLRVQIVSEIDFINEFKESVRSSSIEIQPKEIDSIDQEFGLAEAAAIIAILYSAAQLAEKIVDVWTKTKRPAKVTVTTPKGSVSIEADAGETIDSLVEKLKPVFT